MKKQKEESPAKAAKKKAREAIQIRLVKAIKTIAVELGQDALDIEKEAKKIAKKIAKSLKPAKKTDKIIPPAGDAKKTAAPKEKVVSKSTAVIAKKPVNKAATSKTTKQKPAVKSVPQKRAKK